MKAWASMLKFMLGRFPLKYLLLKKILIYTGKLEKIFWEKINLLGYVCHKSGKNNQNTEPFYLFFTTD